MKSVTVSEAKAHLSRLLKRVERGESVMILHRGRPDATLEPISAAEGEGPSRLLQLEVLGIIKRGAEKPDLGFMDRPRPKAPPGRGLLAALLEERDESR